MSIKFYAGSSCYKSWSGTNEAWKHGNLTEVCIKSKDMIPAQLETKQEAEQVASSTLTFNVFFPSLGWLALIQVTSEAEQPGVPVVAWPDRCREGGGVQMDA